MYTPWKSDTTVVGLNRTPFQQRWTASAFSRTIGGAALACVALLAATLPASPASAIAPIDGSDTRVTSAAHYPFVGLIARAKRHVNLPEAVGCTGSLIDPYWVLTAAHCGPVRPYEQSFFAGRTSVTDKELQGAVIAASYSAPADPTTGRTVDVALFRLDTPLSLPWARIAEGSENALWAKNSQAVSVGWGDQGHGDAPASADLRHAASRVTDVGRANGLADAITIRPETNRKSQLVAAKGVVAEGDSGGPLLVPSRSGGWSIVGVLHGPDEGSANLKQCYHEITQKQCDIVYSPVATKDTRRWIMHTMRTETDRRPRNLRVDPGTLRFRWDAPVDTEGLTGYRVLGDDGAPVYVQLLPADTTTYEMPTGGTGPFVVHVTALYGSAVSPRVSLTVSSSGGPDAGPVQTPYKIAPSVYKPVPSIPTATLGYSFSFVAALTAGTRFLLGGNPSEPATLYADDSIVVTLTNTQGLSRTVTHDFTEGCTKPMMPAELDLTSHLWSGDNRVTVTVVDSCGLGAIAHSELWFLSR